MSPSCLSASRSVVGVSIAAALLTTATFLAYYQVKFGLNHPPAATGDEPDYDSLGWELRQGRGFQVDYTDPVLRAPYDEAAKHSDLYRLPHLDKGPIAYRPPLFPLAIAAIDVLAGHQFWGVRILNGLCMGLTCGMIVWGLHRKLGMWGTCCALFLFIVVDTRTRLYGRAILTEAMAATWVAVFALQAWRLGTLTEKYWQQCVWMGLTFGLAVLTRTQFILWLPGMLLLIAALSVSTGDGIRLAGRNVLLFAGTCLLVLAPWGIRNCLVLERFMPLGSQGLSQLSAGFGDDIWESGGLWTNLETNGFFGDRLTPDMSSLEKERVTADYSKQQALHWIAQHPVKTLALVALKLYEEFRPRTLSEGVLLLLACWGGFLARRDAEAWILFAFVAMNCFAIAATWSVEGRFLVPLLFVQHTLAAGGLSQMLTSFSWQRNPTG